MVLSGGGLSDGDVLDDGGRSGDTPTTNVPISKLILDDLVHFVEVRFVCFLPWALQVVLEAEGGLFAATYFHMQVEVSLAVSSKSKGFG